jgi:hypothetical protein
MAKRIVGLIGIGTGPKLHAMGHFSVEVKNAEGHPIAVRRFHADGECDMIEVQEHDELVLMNCRFVQFSYQGPSKNLVCNLRSVEG